MAAHEHLDYCPDAAFRDYGSTVSDKQAQHALKLLDRYIDWMAYLPHHRFPEACCGGEAPCTVVDATIGGGDSFLGIEVACHLRTINPHPEGARRKVLIRDTLDMDKLYDIRHYQHDGVELVAFCEFDGTVDPEKPYVSNQSAYVFQDDRYVVIVDSGNNDFEPGDIVITIQKR